MPAAGVVMIIAVVAIVAAAVFYLVSTIVALRQIRAGLDEAITGVVGIIEKSAPVEEVVNTINQNLDAGVDLGEECQLVGVGSVCRQQRTGQIAATARLLGELGVDLHYFGVKLTGLTRPELQRDLRKPFSGGVASLDSESWSLEARYGTRRPDCTHLGRDGQPNKCNNCPAYAAWWAGGVTNAVTAGFWAASRRPQQTALFSEYDLLADAP